MTETTPQKHEFQAEVKQVLNIVINSLYKDKEIFIRELVSNASDALEKLRYVQLTEKDIFDDNLPLEISISTDDVANTITIKDFGVGMTRQELIENLGTIAHSGSKAFLEAVQKGADVGDNLIGQFGVGFYSVFMVAKSVKVYTHHWEKDGEHLVWTSDGSGTYELETSSGQRRGSKIEIQLKDEAKEFSKAEHVKQILSHYSNFVQFPINLNGERINTVQAIWMRNRNEIKDAEYAEFYKFQAKAFDEPFYKLHFSSDAPLTINSLLFVPTENQERWGFIRLEPGVSLYCRKILIDSSPKGLLPEWLRFVRGVIDSADLPLNISRETMQDSSLVQKINDVITKRFLKFLEEEAKERKEKYEEFYNKFGLFLKEGIVTDINYREQLSKLLRFESSQLEKGKLSSFSEYVLRMKEDQKEIYYLNAPTRESSELGPHLEYFRARDFEVLFLYDPIDDFVMSNLREFEGKKLISADSAEVTIGDITKDLKEKPLDKEVENKLCEWLKETLGERVHEVSVSKRLVDSPVIALNADKFMSPGMKRIMRAMRQEVKEGYRVNLEINSRHNLIKNLSDLKDRDPDLAKLVAEQLFDNALITAGFLDDPRAMVNRVYKILERVSVH
ncbi:MAG TPA: molecular chaperone HtpG [Thermodesulfobacteriota bacterium]